jgi:hypothetical protein
MSHTLYIIIIITTGLISSIMTMYLHSFKRVFKRIIQRFTRKSPKYAINELEARIDNIERIIANRENNIKQRIKEQVEKQLKEIIND